MRKLIFTCSLLMLMQGVRAQNPIPNSSFELWTVDANGKDSLTNWSSSNAVVNALTVSLKKDSTPFQGAFAAHIQTTPFGFIQYSTLGMLVNGKATFSYGGGGGGANVAYATGGGTPITFKPSALKGFFKYQTLTTSDQGLVEVLLTKYNSTLNKRDTVSYTTFHFARQNSYTAFNITLPDLLPGVTPDTITTFFYSSDPATLQSTGARSDLYIDSLSLQQDSQVPRADFSANRLSASTQDTVILSDISSNTPSARKWTISPAGYTFLGGTSDTSSNPMLRFTTAGNFTVKLRVQNSAGADSINRINYLHITNATTGITDKPQTFTPLFYPNPATESIYLNAVTMGCRFILSDLNGKIILQEEHLTKPVIHLPKMASGMYLISITGDNIQRKEKINILIK